MKYLHYVIMAAVLSLTPLCIQPAFAAGPGGFSGPTTGGPAMKGAPDKMGEIITVEKAKTLRDDARVVLRGNIVSQVAGEKDEFIFRDATGEIQVDIPRKAFGPHNVTPDDTVIIYGKVDHDDRHIEIDVKRLDIAR